PDRRIRVPPPRCALGLWSGHHEGAVVPSIEVAVPFQDNWYFDAVCAGIRSGAEAAEVDVHIFAETPGAAGRALVAERFDAALEDDGCVGAIGVGFEFQEPQV